MNIGTKIRQARINAQLTQEQAAEALGVSRQTMSNWENGKTYPDIVSVITMSDLYGVSLDRLLKEKEETPVSNYMDYLAESTNVVKSKNKLSEVILVSTYLGIWAFSLLVFWLFTDGADAMGYSLVFLWLVLPVTTFVISLLIGRNGYWGKWKWAASIAFGVMYMLAEYATFSLANMVAFSKINQPSYGMILAGGVISLAGLGIGAIVSRRKNRKHS